MTPNIQQLLMGVMATLSTPLPPEASGDFGASRNGMVGNLAVLALQEADKAVPVRLAENKAIGDLLAAAAARYPDTAPPAPADELTISGLDRINAGLRRQLIALHTDAEKAGDTALHHDILRLYRDMARGRRLGLGGG
jgi:hypothetical protein